MAKKSITKEFVWEKLQEVLSDEFQRFGLTKFAGDIGSNYPKVKPIVDELLKDGVIEKQSGTGNSWNFRLLKTEPVPSAVHVGNQIIGATPAGTEVMAAFEVTEEMETFFKTKPSSKGRRNHYWDRAYDDDLDDEEDDEEDVEDLDDEDDDDIADRRARERRARERERERRTRVREDKKRRGTLALKRKLGQPEVFFQFVKTKFEVPEKKIITDRLQTLSSLVKGAEINGQTALYEHLAIRLTELVREQELFACGYGPYLPRNIIEGNLKKVPKLTFNRLNKYPRVIPADVTNTIATVKSKNLFDRYWVLYIAGPKDEKKITSTADKIRKKDPILFGEISSTPDRLYFIADWTDEFCDMTMEKMLGIIREDDPTYVLPGIPKELDKEYLEELVAEVKERDQRLKKTHGRNYRRLMEEEEERSRQREIHARAEYMAENFKESVVKLEGESWLKDLVMAEAEQLPDAEPEVNTLPVTDEKPVGDSNGKEDN